MNSEVRFAPPTRRAGRRRPSLLPGLIRHHRDIRLPAGSGSWRRRWADHRFDQYNRLLALVLCANLAVLGAAIWHLDWFRADGIDLAALNAMAVINLAAAVLIRQQRVINLLFRLATAVPHRVPLAIRAKFGKVYHFGGLHSGGALAASVWFAVLAIASTWQWSHGLPGASASVVALSWMLVALLAAIVVTALPRMRARWHDLFERMHRFGGWSSLALFWLHSWAAFRASAPQATPAAWLASPGTWALAIVTLSVISPWWRLRRVPVEIARPSTHVALTRFDHGVTPFAGSATAISRNPLLEWHSFANVPTPGRDGFRLTISRAGDWTGRFIDDRPSHVWVRGIPTAGVGNVDKLFRRVVWVATGSGIGPALPHLLSGATPAQLVWSTRTPRTTYGDTLVGEILAAQPNAVIWDTVEQGKPDLVRLAYIAHREFDAEAVIVIANQTLTRQVVSAMEARGIPAYGAIWDS